MQFGSANFLLSGRVNGNSEVIYHRDPKERVQKVAPWLTLDDDVYPAIIPGEGDEEGRIVWVLDGYTTTDRYPGAERESFATIADDAFQDDTGLRTLPTDEVNYVRNAVKATVDAYDGTVTLYEWDASDPILQAWRGAFPGTVKDRSEIPDALTEHLRYPEDLFKVQRYQYARYHVTDPNQWIQGNDRWEVPADPNNPNNLQPPYRMFTNRRQRHVHPQDQAWSLTSVFVPFDRKNLAAYVSVDSDATSETYGQLQVINVLDDQAKGPGQIANDMRSDSGAAELLAPFRQSGSSVTYGNVLTVPVGERLLNVEPVYAERGAGSAGSYPILRYVLVGYNGNVGIGVTLVSALADALGVDPVVTTRRTRRRTPTPAPRPRAHPRSRSPSSSPTPRRRTTRPSKPSTTATSAATRTRTTGRRLHRRRPRHRRRRRHRSQPGAEPARSRSPVGLGIADGVTAH